MALCVAILSFLVSCQQKNSETPSEPAGARSNPTEALKQQTEDLERRTKAELDDFDRRIDRMKKSVKQLKTRAAKDAWNNTITDLSNQRDAVKNRLGELKSAGADTWQKAKDYLDAALTDLRNSYDAAVKKSAPTVPPPLRPEPRQAE
jgi:TolA-binding protein